MNNNTINFYSNLELHEIVYLKQRNEQTSRRAISVAVRMIEEKNAIRLFKSLRRIYATDKLFRLLEKKNNILAEAYLN